MQISMAFLDYNHVQCYSVLLSYKYIKITQRNNLKESQQINAIKKHK